VASGAWQGKLRLADFRCLVALMRCWATISPEAANLQCPSGWASMMPLQGLVELFSFCSNRENPFGADMDRQLAQQERNIARIRRDIRIHSAEMQALIDADIDCTNAARVLIRMQADLVLFLEKRERLISRETARMMSPQH
jgi:hypothetical protein